MGVGATIGGNDAVGNTAAMMGGGVFISGGAFTMTGGTISGNKANGSNLNQGGGGVYVSGSGGSFTMAGGTISGNEASEGGGVSVDSGDFTMAGGTISGNTASAGNGGGVYVASDGIFMKKDIYAFGSSGIIYGMDATGTDKNTAVNGHAVYVSDGPKKRDNTANTANELYSTQSGAPGGWD
jgi:hypothetical protein